MIFFSLFTDGGYADGVVGNNFRDWSESERLEGVALEADQRDRTMMSIKAVDFTLQQYSRDATYLKAICSFTFFQFESVFLPR